MMARNIGREHAFLTRAGNPDFTTAAQHRLTLGERLYGDAWRQRTISELLAEVTEEALDMGAWSALAMQALDRADLNQSDRDRLIACLDETTQLAAKAYAVTVIAATIARKNNSCQCGRPVTDTDERHACLRCRHAIGAAR